MPMYTTARRLLFTGVVALALATVTACGDEPPDTVPDDGQCVAWEAATCGVPAPGPSEETSLPDPVVTDDPTIEPWDSTDPYVPDGPGGVTEGSGCAYWGEIGCGDDQTITVPPPDLRPWS
ncbi:hypothetical protein [Streptomyces neyagawaensis]|uniref:hypothetical protein n=1 Tax=Streptomyces neyagawaensis TaxID=42238 RepID=UPI00201CCBA9|nr:hypothetical protein [Streptomyces neyagawaensis]MCL6738433.1 hypothetical protein [Streptomyces neyagawaensis]MDE1688048.1 hypothetical protein [Streptomyces neyagawaensis]